jgi:hypothetical protein
MSAPHDAVASKCTCMWLACYNVQCLGIGSSGSRSPCCACSYSPVSCFAVFHGRGSRYWLEGRHEVFLMPLAHMAELVLHTMAGMYCGLAHGLLRLHRVVARGPASLVLPVLLVVVALLVGALLVGALQLLASSMCSSCWPLSASPMMIWSMLPYDLPSAGLKTSLGASIFVF